MELLRDMALLPVAGSIALVGAIITIIFLGFAVLLPIAAMLGGPMMVVWGVMTITSGNTLLGAAVGVGGFIWWMIVAASSEINVNKGHWDEDHSAERLSSKMSKHLRRFGQ